MAHDFDANVGRSVSMLRSWGLARSGVVLILCVGAVTALQQSGRIDGSRRKPVRTVDAQDPMNHTACVPSRQVGSRSVHLVC